MRARPRPRASAARIHCRAVAAARRSRSSAAPARSGYGLALRWARAGHAVVIGSRSEERAAEAARKLSELAPDAEIEGLPNEQAAKQGSVVFLTVPFRAQSENLNNLREALEPGQLLVDCTVPLAAAVERQGDALARRLAGLGGPAGAGDGPRRRRPWSRRCTP